jgi:hypothetical protein
VPNYRRFCAPAVAAAAAAAGVSKPYKHINHYNNHINPFSSHLLRGLWEVAVDRTASRVAGSEGAELNNTYLTINAKVVHVMKAEGKE